MWVYGAWGTVDTQDKNLGLNDDYCSPWVFWVAFAQISLSYGIVLLVVCSFLIWGLLMCCIR